MNRRIETALRSKYNFRKDCSLQDWKETNELCAQGYCINSFSAYDDSHTGVRAVCMCHIDAV